MKVLMIHCTYQYKGGEDTVVEEEQKLLKSQGVEVETLLFDNSKNTILNVLFYPFNLISYFKTKKKIKSFKPDLVHIHNLHFAGSASVIYAIKSLKVPCVVTLHNFRLLCPSATLFHEGKIFHNSLTTPFPWKAIEKKVYKNSVVLTFWVSLIFKLHQQLRTWEKIDKLIVLNDHMKELFIKSSYHFKTNQLMVKPNFSTIPYIQAIGKENFFLFVGRLIEEKGISTLLNAFKGTTHQLKIAGDGPMKEEVEAFAKLNKNVEYLGSVKKPALFDLITRSSALIFPSVWYEGMPLTIIESFACGTPVIASGLGAMKNMVRDGYNGLHFDVGNPEDLSKKLCTWEGFNQEERLFYSMNAHNTYSDYYTPVINFQHLNTIYQSATTN